MFNTRVRGITASGRGHVTVAPASKVCMPKSEQFTAVPAPAALLRLRCTKPCITSQNQTFCLICVSSTDQNAHIWCWPRLLHFAHFSTHPRIVAIRSGLLNRLLHFSYFYVTTEGFCRVLLSNLLCQAPHDSAIDCLS